MYEGVVIAMGMRVVGRWNEGLRRVEEALWHHRRG
jgi:hypothetical protein